MIEETTFSGNVGIYGIKSEEIAKAHLNTERCTIVNNDMQFIFAANSVYTDIDSTISQNRATVFIQRASYLEIILGSNAILTGTIVTDNYAEL